MGEWSVKAVNIDHNFKTVVKYRSILLILFNKSFKIKVINKMGVCFMQVTATEFKMNFGKYLNLVLTEDIWITRNGKTVAKVINPNVSSVEALSGILAGKTSDSLDRKSIREERLSRYESDDRH